jgi:transcriptional regulator
MYQPPAHTEDRLPVLHDLIRQIGLAQLVTVGASGLVSNPVPLLLDPAAGPFGTLFGHLARANPQWSDLQPGPEALAIFAGPDGYVSPSLYPSKAASGGRVVPTWDYVVVQARGPLIVHDDPAWVGGLVRQLTASHEAGRHEPWAVDDAPARYLQGMLAGIVGIELPLTRIEGKLKLSQNRPPADIAAVLAAFEQGGPRERAVAAAMRDTGLPGAEGPAAPPTG